MELNREELKRRTLVKNWLKEWESQHIDNKRDHEKV
jgi:hypothetical protein